MEDMTLLVLLVDQLDILKTTKKPLVIGQCYILQTNTMISTNTLRMYKTMRLGRRENELYMSIGYSLVISLKLVKYHYDLIYLPSKQDLIRCTHFTYADNKHTRQIIPLNDEYDVTSIGVIGSQIITVNEYIKLMENIGLIDCHISMWIQKKDKSGF